MVANVTAIDTHMGTNLLVLGVIAYDDSPDQDESLANPNVCVCNIDDRYKHRGGRQSLLTDYGEISIDIEE